MKSNLIYIFLVFLLCSCEDSIIRSRKKKKERLVPEKVLNEIHEGDVLLRYAEGPFSEKIVEFMAEKNPISHCGLAVKMNGKIIVVHSVSEEMSGHDGVQIQELPVFSSDIADSMFIVLRPKISDSLKAEIAGRARYYLSQKTPFDHEYNTLDSSKLYCGELLYYTVGSVMGKNLVRTQVFDDTVQLVMFNSFLESDRFDLIWSLKPLKK
ncbi:MAG: hypothetical protein ACOZCO_00095 [Bacteroidota bacterium]